MKVSMSTKLIFIGLLVILSSCDNNNNPFVYQKDAHGRGKTKIHIEESFKPLFTTCIETFMSQFPKAKVTGVYGAEDQLIADFYKSKRNPISKVKMYRIAVIKLHLMPSLLLCTQA
jgi:hypothetical protein